MKKTLMKFLAITILTLSFVGVFVNADAGDITGFELEARPKDGDAMSGFVFGSNQIHLTVIQRATNDGDEARIRVYVDPATTLGDILTINWDTYVVKGYRPHVDIYLDLDGDDVKDTCLVAEYAYANGNSITSTLNTWLSTFEGGSGAYPSWGPSGSVSDLTSINGETAVWENYDGQLTLNTLAAYQTPTGITHTIGLINEDTDVLYFEIEIDDWIPTLTASEAYVKNIELNGVDVLDTCLSSFVGPMGLPGADGADGTDGADGIDGVDGVDGERGPRGYIGSTGSTGLQGPQGMNGTQGETGPVGSQGEAGSQGVPGEAGETGIQGSIGQIGPQGESGEQGPKGETGEQGSRGAIGLDGPQGDPAEGIVYGGIAVGGISLLGVLYLIFGKKP